MNVNRVLKVLTGAGAVACVLSIGLAVAQEDFEANEAAAIGALKTITTAQAIFREGDKELDGNLDYGMLSELSNVGLVDSALGSGKKNGYLFQAAYSLTTSEFLWFGTASPEKPGETGERYFFTDASGVIYESKKPFKVDPETCKVPEGLTPAKAVTPERTLCRELGALAGADGARVAELFQGVAPDQVYVFKTTGPGAGELTVKIDSKTDKELSYTVSGEGPSDRTEKFKLTPGKSRFSAVTPLKRTKIREDSVVVSGVQFPCVVWEISERGGREVMQVWACPDRFPFVLKVETQGHAAQLELVQMKGVRATLPAACAKCSAAFDADDRYCGQCGTKRPGIVVSACPSCGTPFKAEAKFCTRCGRSRPE